MKLMLTLTAIAGLAMAAPSAPFAGNPSVHGNFLRSNGFLMKIDAVILKDGRVIGGMRSESPSGAVYTVAYDKVTFTPDAKGAYLHGWVTYSSNNPALIGHESIEKVIDNGEGNNDVPDSSSPVINPVSLPTNYEAYIDGFAQSGIVWGNLQVLAH